MNFMAYLDISALVAMAVSLILYLSRTRVYLTWDRWSLVGARFFLAMSGLIIFFETLRAYDQWLTQLAFTGVILTFLASWLLRHALIEILWGPLIFFELLLAVILSEPSKDFSLINWTSHLIFAFSLNVTLLGLFLLVIVRWPQQAFKRPTEENWSPWSFPSHVTESLMNLKLISKRSN